LVVSLMAPNDLGMNTFMQFNIMLLSRRFFYL
jgi:hypothetical protein